MTGHEDEDSGTANEKRFRPPACSKLQQGRPNQEHKSACHLAERAIVLDFQEFGPLASTVHSSMLNLIQYRLLQCCAGWDHRGAAGEEYPWTK